MDSGGRRGEVTECSLLGLDPGGVGEQGYIARRAGVGVTSR